MYPLTIALATGLKETGNRVQRCLKDLPVSLVFAAEEAEDPAALLDVLEKKKPDVVLLDIEHLAVPAEECLGKIRAAAPDAMLIAVNGSADPELILAAMRAGANEYLYPPFEETLRRALERKSNERSRMRERVRPGSKIVAFFSAKGGCGATTLACHVGVELGRLNQKVLLGDLDLDAGMLGFLMKTKTTYSLLDAVNNLHRLDPSYWKGLVSNGIPNVEIIPGPANLAARAPVQREELQQVLGFVRSQYDWTILDLGRGLNQLSLGALECTDEAYLVTTLELPALHQAKHIIQMLLDGGYGKERLRLILNRVSKHAEIPAPDLEKMLGVRVFGTIPSGYSELYECYSEGKLLARSSTLGKHIARLSTKVAGIVEEPQVKKSFFSFGRG